MHLTGIPPVVRKIGARYASSDNIAYCLVGELAVGDLAIARAADGLGGLAWEVLPVGSGSAGSLTVEEVDGAPSYASTTTLRVDQADGLTLSQPSAGVARLDLSLPTVSRLMTGSYLLPSVNVWHNVNDGADVSIDLPVGKYLVTGTVLGSISSSGVALTGTEGLYARLYNSTDGATVPGTGLIIADTAGNTTVGTAVALSAAFATVYTVAGTKTLKFQASYNGGAGVFGDVFGQTGTPPGTTETFTHLHAVRIG